MKKSVKVIALILTAVLCMALVGCNNTATTPSASPAASGSPAVSPATTGSPAPSSSPNANNGNNAGSASTTTINDLVGVWAPTGETAGASLEIETGAIASLTFVTIANGEVKSYSGAARLDGDTLYITDRNSKEEIGFSYTLKSNELTLKHDKTTLTFKKQ